MIFWQKYEISKPVSMVLVEQVQLHILSCIFLNYC